MEIADTHINNNFELGIGDTHIKTHFTHLNVGMRKWWPMHTDMQTGLCHNHYHATWDRVMCSQPKRVVVVILAFGTLLCGALGAVVLALGVRHPTTHQ